MTHTPALSFLQSRRVHLGVCGSVAAYKAIEIMRALQRAGLGVSVTLTQAAGRFLTPLSFEALGADPVNTDMFGQDQGVLFGHLQPGRTAHALLIAPATATTLARLAGGLADDMLAAQALAFTGPLLLAPAMNPHMWANPATQRNVNLLRDRGCVIIGTDSGVVACGDSGEGKLAPVDDIVFATLRALCPQDYAGAEVLVTLGPTWEKWDDVRVWTNRSTGRMGAALVRALALRGARVHAVAGPGVPVLPSIVQRVSVESAEDMLSACSGLWPRCTHGVFTAAVADFKPKAHAGGKFKKSSHSNGFSLTFAPNPDILATLSAQKNAQKILGFAAETDNLEQAVRQKLLSKGADLIAGNLVGRDEGGFASASNRMCIVDAKGKLEHWPLLPKDDVAWRLLDWLSTL